MRSATDKRDQPRVHPHTVSVLRSEVFDPVGQVELVRPDVRRVDADHGRSEEGGEPTLDVVAGVAVDDVDVLVGQAQRSVDPLVGLEEPDGKIGSRVTSPTTSRR